MATLVEDAAGVAVKGCAVIGASTVKEAHACFLGYSRGASASEGLRGRRPNWCRSGACGVTADGRMIDGSTVSLSYCL